jgi:hypothetical protein
MSGRKVEGEGNARWESLAVCGERMERRGRCLREWCRRKKEDTKSLALKRESEKDRGSERPYAC